MSRVRIVGGTWRSRLLDVADVPGLRPTPDRVRETLFNWLGQDLAGMRCLDLFAGTGALGFEAASRGAAQVTLVERDPKALAQLKANAAKLDARNVQLRRADALQFLRDAASSHARHYDLLFLDPPYRQDWLARVEPLLDTVLDAKALIYVEAEFPVERLDSRRVIRNGRAGQVYYQLLEPDGL
ncbi:MAG TPA: 16S rRNA (guanine(966)-N(2))-methyltransferase RsmD [Rhodocyclaceae bacterium]|nr:16S rRNA (guanine(966)-N(2))-methyltransferase RsmD [Rhodocyclaceae bacterium]HMV54466.1 16S rRNA (guanine(966)-N(2))-methyltransferase RsmD [Rhodocyclaceae bacterium]HMZ83181.1 16S rRNA (guanine(966)-N(2))-methyltransferase RsmD [Rhodocyclaceae bacterium]HNA02862.1 16S rRNA (guanine(966)-N(2))-methyltransferase RsmD [Rhodocyclaceae bacterium]HNB77930.1 16S rRNA (guanine(966)-N(2))-methyltransferase RsmD [Rhodocyclaceae bacterium]